MARLTSVSPVLLVTDLDRAVAFWRDGLGFECHVYGDPPNFASASRDEATVLLSLARDVGRIVPNWEIVDGVWNVYIRVDDVDTVYAEVQGRGTPLDYTICDQPWGYREFGVQDPDGHDIAFGQRLER